MRALLSFFLSFSGKFIPKVCSLILGEILAVFVKTLAADGKYPAQNCENLQVPIHMQLSQKGKGFLNFSFHFWNVHQVLNILEKRMIVIANLFSKLETVKILLRPLSKKRCFRRRLDSQHVKASQILAKSP